MTNPVKSGYAFGECILDVSERRLLRRGVEVPLTPKIFDTLVLLVEKAGHLVEKDEFMARLWPGTFVGDDALARNISILRKALGGSRDSQGIIVTVPTRGYRFEASVRETVADGQATSADVGGGTEDSRVAAGFSVSSEMGAHSTGTQAAAGTEANGLRGAFAHRSSRGLLAFIALALVLGAVAGVTTFWLLSTPALPKVTGLEQLTHSGRVDPWPRLVTDGTSIYFLERQGDHWNLMRTSVAGGESQVLPTPARNAVVLDVSPDRTNLLIGSFEERETRMPLWIWPVSGGAFRRVGDVAAYGALWHPNGREIVYSEDDGLYICDADGTNTREFVATGGQVDLAGWSWSPDGAKLRFATGAESWEVDAEGKVLRRLPRSSGNVQNEFVGAWSRDARYFFVDRTVEVYRRDIWAIQEEKMSFPPARHSAVRLTNGPISYDGMTPSKDGHKLFVVGVPAHGDVARYDRKTGQATSLLAGVCVGNHVYSQDGQWIACSSANQAILRMRPDGSDRLVLAAPSLMGDHLKWSPDAKQVAFTGKTDASHSAIFAVPVSGGAPGRLFAEDVDQADAGWSPDGKLIAFARGEPESSSVSIWVLNLHTRQISPLPGGERMRCPVWSPDGRLLAATTVDWHKLMLYDFRTHHWRELAEATVLNGGGMSWSPDGKFLYFQDLLGKNEAVKRIRMDNRKIEVAGSFEVLLRNGVQRVAMTGLAPDGALIVDVDRGGSDIYSLTLDLP